MKHSAWQVVMGILLLCIVVLISWQVGTLVAVHNRAAEVNKAGPVAVIDTRHGSSDLSKVGINNQLERDTNLKAPEQLKAYLEASNVKVIPTRNPGQGLYDSGDSRRKMAGMRKRCEIIDEAAPDLVVSIHQNSYHEGYTPGGQVLYYKTSERGKFLAEILQKRSDHVLGGTNKRTVKVNGNYYLLLYVKKPIAIVECGSPSNGREAERPGGEEHQDRMAWTIHMGIIEYLNTVEQEHQRPMIRPSNQKSRFRNGKAACVRVPPRYFI